VSTEVVDAVRGFLAPREGHDLVPIIRGWVQEHGSNPDRESVLRLWAADPTWCRVQPELDWDYSGAGAFATRAHGPVEVYAWWVDWLQVFESYIYAVEEYRDLGGDWVLVPTSFQASGRDGLPLELHVFQLFHVRAEKVDICRVFFTEAEALASIQGEATAEERA
jgi:hypothetical protein